MSFNTKSGRCVEVSVAPHAAAALEEHGFELGPCEEPAEP